MGRSLRFGSRGGSCTAGGIESGCLRRDAFQLTSHPWPTTNREWASTAGPSDLDRAPGAIRVKTHNSARLEAGIRVEARRSEHGPLKFVRLYDYTSPSSLTRLRAAGVADACPSIPHLVIVNHGVVDWRRQAQDSWREPAYRRECAIGRDHAVVLRRGQCDAGIDQSLLRVEHVERRALTNPRLFAHAIESHLGRRDLGLGGNHLRFGGLQLTPGLDHGLSDLIAG